ncbi:unnamed protein product [Hydatigera taeniaeformis]|uniref:ANK_REP_REGION domain-containing protein n=1 Tax=Hydatigena taeniaeformis TaxID=6205 RepID=A0A0R3X545_HYDTA|nr:unnamed protein product [Hydatigera taeniaeformis]
MKKVIGLVMKLRLSLICFKIPASTLLCLVSCVKVLSETPFSVAYLAKILANEVKSNGPITRSVERLYCAAEVNDLDSVRDILTNTVDFSSRLLINEPNPLRFDVNVSDCYGITPLHVASANENVEVVEFLLSYGADPNAMTVNGMSAITICTLSHLEKRFAKHKEDWHLVELDVGQEPFGTWSRAELVWLLSCDANQSLAPHDNEDIHKICNLDGVQLTGPYCFGGRLRIAECLALTFYVGVADTIYTEVLCVNLRFPASLKTILLLLQHGANPNNVTQPLPPLTAAVRAGDVELSRLLLHFGADPNNHVLRQLVTTSKNTFIDSFGNIHEPSCGGLTALHFAVVFAGEIGVKLTQMLLQRGANPSLRALPDASFLVGIEGNKYSWPISKCDGGRTALHLACAKTYDKVHSLIIVQMLMDHGADPNLLCNGQCALSLALICGNDDVSKCLNILLLRLLDSLVAVFLIQHHRPTSLTLILSTMFGSRQDMGRMSVSSHIGKLMFLHSRQVASLLMTYPQTKVGMGLTHGLGSSLCVVLHPLFEHVRTFDDRLALLAKMIAHCPSGLLNHRVIMPCEAVEGTTAIRRCLNLYLRLPISTSS